MAKQLVSLIVKALFLSTLHHVDGIAGDGSMSSLNDLEDTSPNNHSPLWVEGTELTENANPTIKDLRKSEVVEQVDKKDAKEGSKASDVVTEETEDTLDEDGITDSLVDAETVEDVALVDEHGADHGKNLIDADATGLEATEIERNLAASDVTPKKPARRSVKLTLMNGDDDKPIGPLVDGTVIDLTRTPKVYVTAEVNNGLRRRTGSLQYHVDGKLVQTTNAAPYILTSADTTTSKSWTPTVGSHTVKATAKTRKGGKGLRIAQVSVKVTVVHSTSSPVSLTVPPPKTAPKAAPPLATIVSSAPRAATLMPVTPVGSPVSAPQAPVPLQAPMDRTVTAPQPLVRAPVGGTVTAPLSTGPVGGTVTAPLSTGPVARAPVGSPVVTAPAPVAGMTAPMGAPAPAPKAQVVRPAPVVVAPIARPVRAPTIVDPCSITESFLYFGGHDSAISFIKGEIDLTWSPAFVFAVATEEFLSCGNVTFDVHVASGIFDFAKTNATGPALMNLNNADGSKMLHLSTTEHDMFVTGLEPGMNYTVLVTARTNRGHYSFNHETAEVNVAAMSPVVNKEFTRMVVLPEPSNATAFEIIDIKSNTTIVLIGNLTEEMLDLQPMDFVYFFDIDGNATMAQVLEEFIVPVGSMPSMGKAVAWKYEPKDISDVFDELDMEADMSDPPAEEFTDEEDEDDEEEDQEDIDFEQEFESFPESVQLDFCLLAFPGNSSSVCYEEVGPDGRRLKPKWAKKALGAMKKVASPVIKATKKIATTVKATANTVGKVVSAVVAAEGTISSDKTLFELKKGHTMKLAGLIEIGVKFEATAKSHFSITVSLKQGVKKGKLSLHGGFQYEGYIMMNAFKQRQWKPEPMQLFQKSFRYKFLVGVIPVLITVRPGLYVFAELTAVVEGKARAVASPQGFTYLFEFSYDKSRAQQYEKRSEVKKISSPHEDPEFNLRLNAVAEMGVSLEIDLLLYEFFRATLALDIGVRTELEVGTNLDAIAVTKPIFYVLDKFEVNLFIRIRCMLGLNNPIKDITRSIMDAAKAVKDVADDVGGIYQVAKLDNLSNQLPAEFESFLTSASSDPKYAETTDLAMAEFKSLTQDTYDSVVQNLKGLDKNFKLELILWQYDELIFGTPRIEIKAAEAPRFCDGSDAISLKLTTSLTKGKIPFLNGLKGGLWFANFDGKIFREETSWVLSADRTNVNSVTLSLPRAAVSEPDFSSFAIEDGAKVYLRATPEIFPLPANSMYVSAELEKVFSSYKFEPFQCCDDSDCAKKFSAPGTCTAAKVCERVPTEAPAESPATEEAAGATRALMKYSGPLVVRQVGSVGNPSQCQGLPYIELENIGRGKINLADYMIHNHQYPAPDSIQLLERRTLAPGATMLACWTTAVSSSTDDTPVSFSFSVSSNDTISVRQVSDQALISSTGEMPGRASSILSYHRSSATGMYYYDFPSQGRASDHYDRK